MTASTSTATIVFTDLVGSTTLRSALGEERADELRRVHDRLLGERVTANQGRIVKGGGDGLLAAFDSASAALTACVEIQQAVAAYNRRADRIAELSVRIGLSAGDVSWEDGDCFGTPVVEAARLEAAAAGGQIVCSDLVRLMARGRGGHELVPIGELDLKGLPQPISAFEARWNVAEPRDDLPLPPGLVVAATGPFVGRGEVLATILSIVEETERAAPTVIWLEGEPGIGKTRLAAELAGPLHAAGWAVLFGRCDEALHLPYQPIAEALRHYVAHSSDGDLQETLGGRPELVHLSPDLAQRLGPAIRSGTGEQDQYRLFDAVRHWLDAVARRRPLLIVVDDVQWASSSTLLLLNYLARTLETGRIAIVGTVRDTECPDELQSIMDEGALRPGGLRVRLRGLDATDVAVLAGSSGHPDRAEGLHARTAGNPLFVHAVLVEGDVALDASVRRRVGRLGNTARETLLLASLAGLDFELAIVAHAVGAGELATLAGIEESVQAGLVEGAGGRRFRFAHALVRDVLVRQVSEARQLFGHRALAEAYQALRPDDVAALARHWLGAADDPASVGHAAQYLRRAGDAALAASDFDGAARAYQQAVQLVGDGESTLRAELGFALGRARLIGGSHTHHTQDLLLDAADRAGRLGLVALQVDATVLGCECRMMLGSPSREGFDAVARLAQHPPEDPALRARVLALTANSFAWAGRRDEAISAGAIAVAAATEAGDDYALAWAHNALSIMLPVEQAADALTHSRAVIELSPPGNEWVMTTWRIIAVQHLTTTGDLKAARRELQLAVAQAERGREPFVRQLVMTASAVEALLAGDLAESERRTLEAERLAELVEDLDASGLLGVQMFSIRREQGRLQEIVPALRLIARLDRSSAWRPGLAAIYAELGLIDETVAELDRLIVGSHIDLPDDVRRLASMSYLVDAVTAVGDRAKAAVLYDAMVPWSGLWATMFAIACYGPVDRFLGMLAFAMDDLGRAEQHLEAALTQCVEMGSPTYEAHTRYWLARVLAEHGQPARATHHLEAAATMADRIGMTALTRRAHALRAEQTR